MFQILFATLVSMSFATTAPVAKKSPAQVKLQVSAERVDGVVKVITGITVKNKSMKPIKILDYQLPQDAKPTGDYFLVMVGEQKIPYIGIMAKRPAPTKKDYVTILPGKSIYGSFDLSEAYQWNAEKTKYRIRYMPGTEYESQELEFEL